MPAARPHPHRLSLTRALALSVGAAATGAAGTQLRVEPAPAPAPRGANFVLTNCNDSGAGSLRQAMLDAHNNTTVDFGQLTCSLVTLTSGALVDPGTDSLKLVAPVHVAGGRPQPSITIDANDHSRVIEHRSGGSLELTGLALKRGHTTDAKGGCIYANGHVTATATTISGCTAASTGAAAALGGGVWSDDQVDLVFSTVSGNVALAHGSTGYAYGGGVFSSYGVYAVFSAITGNQATGFGYGGGIGVTGPVAIRSSLVSSNVAAYGGGLGLFGGADVGSGDLVIIDSTIAFNNATGFAAGIEAGADLAVYNSTIANNSGSRADHANGIVIEGSHTLKLVSTIVALNTAGGDISGAASISGDHDLVGQSSVALPAGTLSGNPQFAAFADWGGQTMALALQAGSPAVGAGANPLALPCDQRGGSWAGPYAMSGLYPRQVGAQVDIGAVEYGSADAIYADGFETPSASCYPS
ncbi:MAG TPA: choice-of-anchor Q domain-containing protein [Dokdonella sp.]|nr:choice-of-anchor Q domain-containing protein [Dokdonella sp.]